jgi:tetratricopeptide (TPR) repeat protein
MKYTWLVEKYLEGELSGEALRKFELEILRKPEVAEEVERVRSMHRFLQEQHAKYIDSTGLIEDYEDSDNVMDVELIRQDLEGLKVRKISADHKDPADFQTKLTESRNSRTLTDRQSNKVLSRKMVVWLAAASVATLLILSSLLLIGKNASVDYMAVYNKFYEAYPADIQARSLEALEDDAYRSALLEYTDQNYEEAYLGFGKVSEDPPPNLNFHLYKGICAMEMGDFQAAIKSFTKIQSDVVLKHEALWYMGLSYLRMEDIQSARAVFEDIVTSNGYYKKQAKKLLKSI